MNLDADSEEILIETSNKAVQTDEILFEQVSSKKYTTQVRPNSKSTAKQSGIKSSGTKMSAKADSKAKKAREKVDSTTEGPETENYQSQEEYELTEAQTKREEENEDDKDGNGDGDGDGDRDGDGDDAEEEYDTENDDDFDSSMNQPDTASQVSLDNFLF